ncbi:MAG TPA: STN domain-containing protein, partial [Steroidobacteraceae bacterium]|nr:STN domain-containing protein [Steroidobacteraceae bacterium]
MWLVFALLLPALGARAQESAFAFNIPSMDAASALTEFSMQSGLQVLFDYELVQGVRSAPIVGRHGTHEALRQLLAGTGL